MRKLAFLFLLVPLVALWLYGCDEAPTQPKAPAATAEDGTTPLFAPGEPNKKNVSFLATTDAINLGDVVFGDVVFQHAKGYNPSTGVFTAPLRGVYHFSTAVTVVTSTQQVLFTVTVEFYTEPPKANIGLGVLAFDGDGARPTNVGFPGNTASTTPSITLVLKPGQTVRVRTDLSSGVSSFSGYFSGHLLYSW